MELLFYSSLVFFLNVVIGFHYGYNLYASLFLLLMITSLCHHSSYTCSTKIVDKIAIYLVVFYGGYLFYEKVREKKSENLSTKTLILFFLIISTFLSTIILYYYGYMTNSLCYCEDSALANSFHAFMHCVGSFGHICIVVF
jgi:hypothetical protein